MWVAVGIAVVGAVTSIAGGISGKKAAEAAGEATAKNIMTTEAENQRRRKLELDSKLGTISASIYASNLQMSGSAQRYKNQFASSYRAEMSWDKQKARIDARTAEKGGQVVGQQAMYSGIQSAVGFVGQGISAGMGAYSGSSGGGTSTGIGSDNSLGSNSGINWGSVGKSYGY